jgi:hypothetical protein
MIATPSQMFLALQRVKQEFPLPDRVLELRPPVSRGAHGYWFSLVVHRPAPKINEEVGFWLTDEQYQAWLCELQIVTAEERSPH